MADTEAMAVVTGEGMVVTDFLRYRFVRADSAITLRASAIADIGDTTITGMELGTEALISPVRDIRRTGEVASTIRIEGRLHGGPSRGTDVIEALSTVQVKGATNAPPKEAVSAKRRLNRGGNQGNRGSRQPSGVTFASNRSSGSQASRGSRGGFSNRSSSSFGNRGTRSSGQRSSGSRSSGSGRSGRGR